MKTPTLALTFAVLLGASVVGQTPPQTPPPAQAPAAAPQVQPDPQMPPITFRSEINYVEVDAVVRDSQGRFVRDLRQDEFQLLENGKPQSITAFSLVEIPVTRPERALFAPKAVEPDVRTNTGGPEGRVYVIVLDDLHTHLTRSARVRIAARQFIQQNFGANDVAAVVHVGGVQDSGQEFTSNRRLLEEAVGKFMGKKIRSATMEKIDQYNMIRTNPGRSGEVPKDPLEFERAYNARTALDTLRSVSLALAGISGRRKALVYFSEGIDYDITDFYNKESFTIIDETRSAIAAATRANVHIYAIDPRGLSTLVDDGMELAGLPADVDPTMNLDTRGLMNESRLAQDSLRTLAEETGGFAAINSNDYTTAFQRVVDENSAYYVIGYYPTNERRDGSFRKIEVRVTRPDLTVRARRGYLAPRGRPATSKAVAAKDGTSANVAAALNTPLPVAGLPLIVFAAPVRGPAPKAVVALVTQVMPTPVMAFTEKDGKFASRIELSVIAIDQQGRVQGGTRESVDLGLRPDTYSRLQQFGFRVLSRLEVPPGRYQLRVAVGEPGGKVGTVHYDLEVPDFSKQPITMGGLTIASAMGAVVPTAGTIPEFQGMLQAPPTAARTFSVRDQLAVLTEIYDNQGSKSHSVDIVATLRADDGRVVFSTNETRSSADLGGKSGGYGYTATVPLKDLMPGLYVLKVEAKSTLAGGAASRELQIRLVQ